MANSGPQPRVLEKKKRERERERESRSAPKGRQQMGETGFCKNLRFPAVSCEKSAVFCANLRLPNPLIYTERAENQRKSAKICENVRFRVRFLPFAVSLLARPERERERGERGAELSRHPVTVSPNPQIVALPEIHAH